MILPTTLADDLHRALQIAYPAYESWAANYFAAPRGGEDDRAKIREDILTCKIAMARYREGIK